MLKTADQILRRSKIPVLDAVGSSNLCVDAVLEGFAFRRREDACLSQTALHS